MIPLDSFGGMKERLTDSLNEGFVCRNEKSDQYYCVYKNSNSSYDEGFIHESEISDLLDEGKSYLSKDEINLFFKISNITKDYFSGLPILSKIDTLLKYFGNEKVFGKSLQNLTFSEAMTIIERE